MVRELHRRTTEYFEDADHTPLDYAVAWIERGRTLQALAQSITESVNGGPDLKEGQWEITRHMLDRYLREIGGSDAVSAKLVKARKDGAHGLVEEGLQTLDDSDTERDTLNANRVRFEARERLAALWNREEYAQKGQGVNVTLSFGELHLAALQRQPARATAAIAATADSADPVEQLPE